MLRSAYVKGALLALVIIILAVEAYFVYRYYDRYYGVSPAPDAASISSSQGTTAVAPEAAGSTAQYAVEEATIEKTDEEDQDTEFAHTSTPENIVDNSTYLDHPSTTGNPDAILLVTQDPDTVANPRPIGVWYDVNRGGKWAVFNQDLAPMPEGVTFSILLPGDSADVTVHRATPENTVDNVTYLDHPKANDNPDAVLSVTPNWNPGGGNGLYNNHFVDVRYDADEERWTILNEDGAQMPSEAAFNVLFSASAG
ncbi:MAG: hypothetical protein ACFB50_15800 [Rubrobacteraceae bacterium]